MSLNLLLNNTVVIAQVALIIRAITTVVFLFVLHRQIQEFQTRRLFTIKLALTAIVLIALVFSVPSWMLAVAKANGTPPATHTANVTLLSSALSGLLISLAFLAIYKKTKE